MTATILNDVWTVVCLAGIAGGLVVVYAVLFHALLNVGEWIGRKLSK